MKPDILIFMSDQHNAKCTSYAGHKIVHTPNLDKLAKDGCVFTNAYTSCPLCVPARLSMLTGQLPEKTGFYTNDNALSEEQATFLHSLGANGYETVLIGRMHFLGVDQNHGFTKRLVGDYTPQYWGRYGQARVKDLGPYVRTSADQREKVVGGGTSPVLEYDKAVIDTTLDYLSEEHDKPQCIIVGTYGPHHTFVSPPDLYKYYLDKVTLPKTWSQDLNYDHTALEHMKIDKYTDEQVLQMTAAYYGMITTIDQQMGQVREAFSKFTSKRQTKSMFVYLSDHGEQLGERYYHGKTTFFEESAKIPMIIQRDDLDHQVINAPVSIMDIGPTVCDVTRSMHLPNQDGKSLYNEILTGDEDKERTVISEFILRRNCYGRMIRQGDYKLITYDGYDDEDLLFNITDDPCELNNIADSNQGIVRSLKEEYFDDINIPEILKEQDRRRAHHVILSEWGKNVGVEEPARWDVPEHARTLPIV